MALKRIGHIVNTYGLKGDLKVLVTTNKPEERFSVGNKVHIKDVEYVVKASKDNKGCYVLHLSGIEDCTTAEKFRGLDIMMDITLEDGGFFFEDIVGFEVIDMDEKIYGQVSDYAELPNQTYLVCGKYYLPYSKPQFVDHIDFVSKKVVISELAKGIFE